MRKYNYSNEVVLTDDEEGFELSIPRRYQNDTERTYDLSNRRDAYDWQVTYKFSSRIRPNKFRAQYGSKNMSFRRLYVILCERFNGGNYFIDDYFNKVYPFNGMKEKADLILTEIQLSAVNEFDDILSDAVFTKAGNLDKRYKKKLQEILLKQQSVESLVDTVGARLAREIKDDIINCLATGQIPLMNSALAESTREARIKAGLPSDPKFFASSSFINDISIYCRLEKKEWQSTKYPHISV